MTAAPEDDGPREPLEVQVNRLWLAAREREEAEQARQARLRRWQGGKRVKRAPTSYPDRPGMKDAIERTRHGRRVKPNETDAPPLSTFPGPKEKRLPGQLSLTESP